MYIYWLNISQDQQKFKVIYYNSCEIFWRRVTLNIMNVNYTHFAYLETSVSQLKTQELEEEVVISEVTFYRDQKFHYSLECKLVDA